MNRSLLLGCVLWGWLGGTLLGQPLTRFEFSHAAMGTEFRIVLYAEGQGIADEMAQSALARVDELNAILSDYDSNSELSRLSATAGSGQKVAVSEDLWIILKAAQALSEKSQGAFDVSIGPLSKLWRRGFRRQEMPEASAIAAAQAQVGSSNIRLHPRKRKVELVVPNMRLDLGGIAKGYAAEAAYRVMAQEYGHPIALVDAGGDLFLGAPPPGKNGWEVQLPSLDQRGVLTYEVQSLSLCAIATSGDAYRYLEAEGVRYSHLIDPRTGYGQTEQRLVSVIAGQGMLADAWASIASIATIEELGQLGIGQLGNPCQVQILFLSREPAEEVELGPEIGEEAFLEQLSQEFPADLMEAVLGQW
ncbi:MAG: FAD:protein FMN transferase [Bacteroidota bacterium]